MADANALARFDLGAQPRDRPVAPVGHRFLQQGVITRKAASLFTGAGPGATLAFSAATPPFMKSLRQRRTVSSRTPNASARGTLSFHIAWFSSRQDGSAILACSP